MKYVNHPSVKCEIIRNLESGIELHVYTTVKLDCHDPRFQLSARSALELEALSAARSFFNSVVLHQL